MILVASASKYGSTAEVAQFIADTLCENRMPAESLPVQETDNPAMFVAS